MSLWTQGVIVLTGSLAARLLGPEHRGYLALLLLLPPALTQLGTLGIPLALTYHIARDESHARTLIVRCLRPATSQAACLFGINGLVVVALALAGRDDLVPAALIELAAIPAWVVVVYALAILQGRQQFLWFQACRMLPVTLYLVLLTCCIAIDGDRLVWATGAWVSAYVAFAALSAWLAWRGLPKSAGTPVVSMRELRRFGLRSVVGSTSLIEILAIDKAVVWWLLGPEAVGLYVVSSAFTTLPQFIGQSFGFVAYPRIAAARAHGGDARRAGAQLLGASFAVTVPVCALMFLAASEVVDVFAGGAFAESVAPARMLLVAALVISTRRVVAECARGAGYGGLDSIAEAALWIVYLPAAWLLTDAYGLTGAAAGLAVGAAAALIVLAALFWRRAGRSPAPVAAAVAAGE